MDMMVMIDNNNDLSLNNTNRSSNNNHIPIIQERNQDVPQIISQDVPDVSQTTSHDVPDVPQIISQDVPDVSQTTSRDVPDVLQIISQDVPDVLQIISQDDLQMELDQDVQVPDDQDNHQIVTYQNEHQIVQESNQDSRRKKKWSQHEMNIIIEFILDKKINIRKLAQHPDILNHLNPDENDWLKINELIDVLSPFYSATLLLSSSNYSTIGEFHFTLWTLVKNLHKQIEVSNTQYIVANSILYKLEQYFKLPDEAKMIASLLDPSTKSTTFTTDEITRTVTAIKRKLIHYNSNFNVNNNNYINYHHQ
ncbi:19840_t:CDS:2 [Entrophospora sp. SA101]|nr:19840_t:CDS:2 [Entrophospora sp. SA101]